MPVIWGERRGCLQKICSSGTISSLQNKIDYIRKVRFDLTSTGLSHNDLWQAAGMQITLLKLAFVIGHSLLDGVSEYQQTY